MSLRVLFAISMVLGLTWSAVLSRGPIIDDARVIPNHISPNGDGVSDSMVIEYDLADTATAVYVLVLQSDSSTVVDTLVGGVPQDIATHQAVWDGTVSGGIRVADDNYVVFVKATNALATDSVFLPIGVDVVSPQVFITDMFPDPYAPSSPDTNLQSLTVEFTTFDPFPSDNIVARVWITDPDGITIATPLTETSITANGVHTIFWDGSEAEDEGVHEAHVLVEDPAGNKDATRSSFRVDIDPPEIEITSLVTAQVLTVIPDSLFGWAWDAGSDIISMEVRYTGKGMFEPVPSAMLKMDTLFFAVQLTDSVIVQENKYNIGFRAVDTFGRETLEFFDITWDATPPADTAIVLNQPPSPTRNPLLVLTGRVDSDVDTMHIYQNGSLIDEIAPNLPVFPEFPYAMTLLPGQNTIYAIPFDVVGNEGASSNVITVVLDESPGLLISEPFVPNDAFLINLSQPASSVTVRVYDLGGNLVQVLSSTTVGTAIAVPWNGRNGDGEGARKGPLVAVVKVNYQDGGSEIFREAFLYEPTK